MSRIHCSQCGQAGHNKRNRNCQVNIQRGSVFSDITTETREKVRKCREYMNHAITSLSSLTDYFQQYHSNPTRMIYFVIYSIDTLNVFCEKINLAIEFDLEERPLIRPQHILYYLSAQVDCFNNIFGQVSQSANRITAQYADRKFSVSWIRVEPEYTRASMYLKTIALVQDLTIEDQVLCECPMCFDEFDSQSVVVTNCKHSFCAPCIKGYSTAIKDKTKRPNCPMCRTDITEFKIGKFEIYEEIHAHLLNL